MDDYHVDNEIAKGEAGSVVYRGRKKRSLEFVAVKSVDKGQVAKVQNEVFVMHQVRSPSVLAFHAWYETRNHLWVITELCAGRLDAIVAADAPLTPEAVQVFASDILTGLAALHGAGLCLGSLRARGVLVDEEGAARLASFTHARPASGCCLYCEPHPV
ncbi:hypothetical protein FNF29_03959 [Cafeteria roenbergensis]|uniref:Protein kinase domain-containing protein n=1 Tax=Cafeteria roenbergensis TaxID=33653 RepID=A0A5A8CH69_CAFRO|nr:hypothetical protein FNF29_03959 [Cafeteria roenbergensis]|eukprot:KAA0152393.1 hypothetical protein FNF29_03959 [Cafeteria roenbergensis]